MKQQVSLPGFAVPTHTPDTQTRDDDTTNAVLAEALAAGPLETPGEHPDEHAAELPEFPADDDTAAAPNICAFAELAAPASIDAAPATPTELPADSAATAAANTLAASTTQAAPEAESAPVLTAPPRRYVRQPRHRGHIRAGRLAAHVGNVAVIFCF